MFINTKLLTLRNLVVIGALAIISHALMSRVYDIIDGE